MTTRYINHAVIGAPTAQRQVLAFMGIDACVEGFELQRFSLLAGQWDARVTIVDAPGIGYGGAMLTSAQCRDLLHGRFDAVVAEMAEVAVEANPALLEESPVILGYSMGASLAATACNLPGLHPREAILIEPVGFGRWNPLALERQVRIEGSLTDGFLDRNPADAIGPRDRRGAPEPPRSAFDLGLLGWAISRGGIPGELLRASRRLKGVHLVRARDSRLCRPGDLADGVDRLRAGGLDCAVTQIDGSHQVWQSLPDVLHLAQVVRP